MFLAWLLSLFIPSVLASPIHLGIGETHSIPSQPLIPVRIEKKGIVQVKDESTRLLFVGKKLGRTQVTIGKRSLQFVVLHKYRKQTLEQLKTWHKTKRGPKIAVVNNLPEIQGRLLRISDFIELGRRTNDKSHFRLTLTTSPRIEKQVRGHLQRLVEANNLPSGHLSLRPHWRYEIAAHLKQELPLYKKILSRYGIEVRLDPLALAQVPVIEVQVFIAYVKKSFMRLWGVQWPSQVQAQLIPGESLNWQSLSLSLNALEESGQGRLLATPRLITESNNLAEFHSGGEIPIRTTTQFNNNVEWKSYGLFLKTKPTANAHKHLKIEINLEMSSLDQEASGTDIPALTRNQVKTQINMKKSRPILISGFIHRQRNEARSGLPWLSQVPLFEPLFSSGQIYDRDFELIFILYPKVIDDSAQNSY